MEGCPPGHSCGQPGRLTSWDAIYFIKAAERGYLFEQEWAFGPALPTCISLLNQALTSLGLLGSSPLTGTAHLLPLIGVVFTNTCHLLSVLVLYHLGLLVWADSAWALVAALLHVLSPAGLFLLAPYNESPFALLSFVGWFLLVRSCTVSAPEAGAGSKAFPSSSSSSLAGDVLTLLAAVSFGLATVFRTNGLLNGAPFAVEFLRTLYDLVEDLSPGTTPRHIRKLAVLGLSGVLVAAGSVMPQFVAYRIYCTGSAGAGAGAEARPWCLSLVPSIYNFVQRHYWNNGLFRYWTVSNAPLFALAAPMLFVMGKSGKDIFFQASRLASSHHYQKKQTGGPSVDTARLELVVRSMAAAQVLLVIMVFTSSHVQIITRISSGYPAWYWWVAACLRAPKTRQLGIGIVVFMVMYSCVQGVLFASFLPPA
ncbi:family 76 glycosyltransferase [Cryphonectria parasitica EP155]|uniref:GPI mannosyltransferase 2 n=1 Tax=Cryphonectria parasitica (strain ATCC 38755 / EP155) TaxID=660469 RepID=A0A9P4XV21_CRYP1|nr:family 76 glycosyltransferase [Cryphonectria parasitica EP155]KAF3761275.1 family 76 glycosyltransferase [Cryphonectria parasitica EP155]